MNGIVNKHLALDVSPLFLPLLSCFDGDKLYCLLTNTGFTDINLFSGEWGSSARAFVFTMTHNKIFIIYQYI